MSTSDLIQQLQASLAMAASIVIIISVILFVLMRYGIARGLTNLAAHTRSKVDDILIRNLQPNRIAWLAPLAFIYMTAFLFPTYQNAISKVSLFFILWLSVITLNGLLNAVNEIYESRPSYNGVSIQGYFDIVKIITIIVGIILSITLMTDESPIVLLTGLGAVAAVLMLIFQSTILSLVASIQIAANDLIKEGDFIEVPSYNAEGDVVNINLHAIKIRNSDMTYTVIPTFKIVDVAYRNWRGIKENGGRRIQRSFCVDMISIRFCDSEMLGHLRKIDLIAPWLEGKITQLEAYQTEHADHYDSPLDGPQITNIEVFRAYIEAYLKGRPDIYCDGKPFLIRVLAPRSNGLPIELYIFTKTTEWAVYESIQAEIFDHLLAAAHSFDLRVFQEPTGLDFSSLNRQPEFRAS